ncbi:uncharacterized protein LOC129582279 [Paramacrobiotus metropolitanus]|uniref:uncharacterized protein LOC129582279 n=1 Tax=Paramacrobiotus metropolitanus TaxID=2943436 RepID=UPI002445DC7B|nr:uncharacterized protein LOC129582279 [Paramacrobiotus metropolitanus]
MMFSKKIYHWNAVNVMQNGLFQRGLIVDKLEFGWVVDFGVAGQQPEVIPYSQQIFLDNNISAAACGSQDPSDRRRILLKLSAKLAWTWYECTVSPNSAHRNDYALVEVFHKNERIVTVARANRLHSLSHTGILLGKDDIVKDGFPVHPSFAPHSSEVINKWRAYFRRTHPVGIIYNHITFLMPRDMALDCDKIITMLKRVKPQALIHKKEEYDMPDIDWSLFDSDEFHSLYDRQSRTGELWELWQQKLSYLTKKTELDKKRYPSINEISLNVLTDIMTLLDGRHQATARSVCSAWNTAAVSADCAKSVTVNYSRCIRPRNPYMFMSLLCHCITPATQYVLFTGHDILSSLPLLSDLRTFKPMPRTFVFSNTTLRCSLPFEGTVVDAHEKTLDKLRTSLAQNYGAVF